MLGLLPQEQNLLALMDRPQLQVDQRIPNRLLHREGCSKLRPKLMR